MQLKYRLNNFSITAKLILTFASIFIFTVLILGIISFQKFNHVLTDALAKKSSLLVHNLSNILADPFSMGEYDRIQNILRQAQSDDPDISYAMLVGLDGRVVATTDFAFKNRTLNEQPFDKEALKLENFASRAHPDGKLFEVAMPVKFQNNQMGLLRIGISPKQVIIDANNVGITIIFVGLILLGMGITLYFFLIRQNIIVPVNQVVNLAEKLSVGDIEQTVDVNRHDEVGKLVAAMRNMVEYLSEMATISDSIAHGDLIAQVHPRSAKDQFGNAFERMVISLRSIVSNVRNSSEQVRALYNSMNLIGTGKQLERDSDTMLAAMEDLASVIEQLSINIHGIANSVDTQAHHVNQTNNGVKTIVRNFQFITDGVKDLTLLAETAQGVVEGGRGSVEQVEKEMCEINSAINSTSQTIQDLGARTTDIGRIVEVINTISDQTNLLALNAAIEAARAGSHGSGFGVVAQEVRKLSERTAHSVEEISQLIDSVQKGVSQAAQEMERSTNLVSSGLNKSTQLVNAFAQIETVVNNVAKTSTKIDAVIIEQSHGAAHVLEASSEMSAITSEIQAASAEQALSAQEIVRVVSRMRDAAERNAKTSEHLSSVGLNVLSQLQGLENAVKAFHLGDETTQSSLQKLKFNANQQPHIWN